MKKSLKGLPAKSLLAALVVLLVTACGQVGLSEDELYQRALQHQASGDLPAALIDFKNVLQQNPSHVQARLGLGVVSLGMGDLGTARSELERARNLGLESEVLRISFGRLWLAEGEYQSLLENLNLSDAEAADAVTQAQILQLRGEAMLALGDPAQAMAYFEEAIGMDPAAPLPHVGSAAVHLAEGRVAEARTSLQAALEINRKTHQAWSLLGDIELDQGRLEQAASAYGEAISTSINPHLLHLKRGLTWLGLADTTAAEKDLAMMRRISGGHPATTYLEGLLHFEAGRYSDAQGAFQATLSRAENFQPAVFLLGAAFFAQQQWTQAEHFLGRFLRANPGSVEAARLLAAVRARDGDLERAEQLLHEVLGFNPDDPLALSLMGDIRLARGQQDAWLEYLQRLKSVQPEDPASRVLLATAMVHSGDSLAGLEEFEAALQGLPEASQLEIAFLEGLVQKGEFQLALDVGQRLSERLPNNPALFTLTAAAHLGLGDLRAAMESLSKALQIAPGDPAASISLAQLAQAAGDTDEARRIYRESLVQHPGHVDISVRLSWLEAQSGNVSAMQSVLEASIQRYPDALAPRLVLGRYYLSNNEPRRVLHLLEPVRESAADNPEMLTLLAGAQIAAGLASQAIATLRVLSARIPDTAEAHYLTGRYFDLAGGVREARQQYRKVLDLQPDHAASLRSLAALELREGRVDEALRLARGMQTLSETAAVGNELEGRILTTRSQYEEASRAFELAYEFEPTADRVILLGRAMQQAGRIEESAVMLTERLARHPDEDVVRLQLAQTLMTLGRSADAIREYEELRRAHPDEVVILNNLAYLYHEEKDVRALDLAERAFALAPNNPSIAHTLGRVLVESGQSERGLRLLAQARSALPENPEVRFSYAAALAKGERVEEARKELSALLDEFGVFPQRADAEALLGTLQ